jgi:hypothetical protein
VHPGGPQRRVDTGDLMPYRFGSIGDPLIDVGTEQGIQESGEDARHIPIPLNALSALGGEALTSILQSNVIKRNRPSTGEHAARTFQIRRK